MTGWLELSFDAEPAERPALLAEVLAPFLAGEHERGAEGFLLRQLGTEGERCLLVQLRGSDDGLAGRAAALPHPPGEIRPATVLPLTGPVFSGADLGPVTRRFLADVAPVTLGLARAAGDRTATLATALDLMTTHLDAVAESGQRTDRPPLSFLSFRSHAEAFLATSRDPEAARRALDERYESVHTFVEDRVHAILRGGEPGAAHAWHTTVRDAKPGIIDRFRAGTLVADTGYAQDHLRERTDFAGSSFHTAAGESAELQSYLGSDPSFLATRLLTSMLYLTLHSVGVTLLERYFLCHAISRACEVVFDVDSLAVLASVTGHPRGR